MALATNKKMQEEEIEAPIHGDILEAILSHVPLIHLVPARHVSKAWKHGVLSSLCHVNPVKPWLTVHTQSHRAPHVTNSYAYDPRSRVWVEIHALPVNHSSPIRSSNSTLLYTLSPAEFSFSIDPLHVEWKHTRAPRVWRVDPIVARVGSLIVVSGGACDFEDDPLAVEMYNTESRAWVRCQSMPAILKESTASTWLSVTVAGGRMHVTEKNSGVTYTFDCDTKTWQGPYDLRPDESVFYCVTETEMVAKLKGEDGTAVVASIAVNSIGDFLYLLNPSEPEEMVVCEVVNGGGCKWGSVRNAVVNDVTRTGRMVFCGGDVGLEDLQRAITQNCKFEVKEE
ncbi:Kelch-type beta propeller [Sesbania bispinosa]|nr:Kelch-type beta propeller [Sesbania bispinosa]